MDFQDYIVNEITAIKQALSDLVNNSKSISELPLSENTGNSNAACYDIDGNQTVQINIGNNNDLGYYQRVEEKNEADGYAGLNENTLLHQEHIPDIPADKVTGIPEYTLSEIAANKVSLLKDGVAVTEIDLSSLDQETYVAGENITINNGEIIAKNQFYDFLTYAGSYANDITVKIGDYDEEHNGTYVKVDDSDESVTIVVANAFNVEGSMYVNGSVIIKNPIDENNVKSAITVEYLNEKLPATNSGTINGTISMVQDSDSETLDLTPTSTSVNINWVRQGKIVQFFVEQVTFGTLSYTSGSEINSEINIQFEAPYARSLFLDMNYPVTSYFSSGFSGPGSGYTDSVQDNILSIGNTNDNFIMTCVLKSIRTSSGGTQSGTPRATFNFTLLLQ